MIAARLVLHVRSIRNIMRALDRASGLYKTIIATLVESGVLYAVSFLLLVGPWASRSVVQFIALQILPEIQVCVLPRSLVHFNPRGLSDDHDNRSLPHSSSSFDLPTGPHWSTKPSPLGTSVRFVSTVRKIQQVVTEAFTTGKPLLQPMST